MSLVVCSRDSMSGDNEVPYISSYDALLLKT